MLSGIGPEEHLTSLKIPVIKNSRVGDHLQSTPHVVLYFDIKNQSEIPKPILNDENEYKYFVEHSGPLAYKLSGVQCFINITNSEDVNNLSDGCILPRTLYLGDNLEELVKPYRMKEEFKEFFKPYINRSYFALMAVLRRPKSFGTIRLRSTNPFDYPIIDPCIFCDESDLDGMLAVLKASLPIYQSDYFKQFAEIYKNPLPGCDPCPDNFLCDSYLKCVIQSDTFYITPTGGCRIGDKSDPNAVVDERLRVIGVSGLRVVDSSIIPLAGEQNQAITMMIGERGAQFTKEDAHKLPPIKHQN
jgi:choline dehydrogenase-like flavoprotein